MKQWSKTIESKIHHGAGYEQGMIKQAAQFWWVHTKLAEELNCGATSHPTLSESVHSDRISGARQKSRLIEKIMTE